MDDNIIIGGYIMTYLYADFTCPECKKEGRLLHEIKDENDLLVFPGETLSLEKSFTVECEFCNVNSEAFIKVAQNKFIGIANKSELDKEEFKNIPKTEDIFEKWKKEKRLSPFSRIDFNKQPFQVNEKVMLSNQTFYVKKIFRTEWVEKDLDIRLELPRPDTYWYELLDRYNKTSWLKVENVEDENIFLSNEGIIVSDNKDIVEEITDNPTSIKRTFESDWFGGRNIEAYQYINGVRILVSNHKNQVEMDIFEDTFEGAMAIVEDNIELGVFNE